MRHSFSSRSEVCHAWAAQRCEGDHGRAGNIYFRGPTIYSYGDHFPIARHLPDGSIAITTRYYSPSTGSHIGHVRSAIGYTHEQESRKVHVLHPCDSASSQKGETERSIHAFLEKAATRRSPELRARDIGNAYSIATNFNRYAKILGERCRIKPPTQDMGLEEVKKAVQKRLKAEHLARKKREAELAEQQADARAYWRRTGAYHWSLNQSAVMLRLNGSVVRSSHGAEISIEDAKRLWPVIQRVMGGDKDYEVGMPLGHYRLTKIRTNGGIVVGCHDIAFDEIEGIARELGLIEQSEGVAA